MTGKAVCCVTGKKRWKKTCCLPSFVIFLFILGCIIAGVTLLAIFRVDPKHLTVNAVLISIASIVGLAFVLNCRTWWQVLDSLLNSQRKRLHSAASKLHKLKSEGFMKVSAQWLWGRPGCECAGIRASGRVCAECSPVSLVVSVQVFPVEMHI